ncbi:hypothetical protein J6590_099458 [Homalodisca vitripennis]|nr:hypothetical protein J6590_099458 [Homalodisca vitripennis]
MKLILRYWPQESVVQFDCGPDRCCSNGRYRNYNKRDPIVDMSLMSKRFEEFILSFFVANIFWISSDEYHSRFQESNILKLPDGSAATVKPATRQVVCGTPTRYNPGLQSSIMLANTGTVRRGHLPDGSAATVKPATRQVV